MWSLLSANALIVLSEYFIEQKQGRCYKINASFFNLAKAKGCDEVWLGSESTNLVAQKLYKSLSPQHADLFISYSFNV